jgi:membrane-bound serine protease (ClpP class)
MILMQSPSPELQVSLRLVLPTAIGFAGIAIVLVRLGVAAQRRPAVTGAAGMIGRSGQALTAIDPTSGGRVVVHGEIWHAVADHAIPEGARVRITGIDGLTLTVREE